MSAAGEASGLSEMLGTKPSTGEFHEAAGSADGMDIDVMEPRIFRFDPSIDAVISIEESLPPLIFRNNDWTVKISAPNVGVTTRQF